MWRRNGRVLMSDEAILKADTPITPEMLTFKRPGTGIWPNKLNV